MKDNENTTISYYNEHALEFCENTINADMSACRNIFISYLHDGAYILDAGCGSGRDSKVFIENGYAVTAIDASSKICEEAEKYLGQPVLCMRFEDIDFVNQFDGIWACASLLHVAKNDINNVLERLRMALKDNGVLYASFKYGSGERMDDKGRFYLDYKEDVKELFERNDFTIEELFVTSDVRNGLESQKWVNVIIRKKF